MVVHQRGLWQTEGFLALTLPHEVPLETTMVVQKTKNRYYGNFFKDY